MSERGFHKSFMDAAGGGISNYGGVLAAYFGPSALTSPADDGPLEANMQIFDSTNVSWLSHSTGWTLTAKTWTNSTAYASWINLDLPARSSGGIRHHRLWGEQHGTSAPPTNSGLHYRFNVQDGSNFWYINPYWTGSQFNVQIVELVAGSGTGRGNALISGIVDHPFRWVLDVWEAQNYIMTSLGGFETDVATDEACAAITYNKGSARNFHTEGQAYVTNGPQTDSSWGFRGIMIQDFTA